VHKPEKNVVSPNLFSALKSVPFSSSHNSTISILPNSQAIIDFPDLKVAVVNKFSKCNYCWKVKQLLNRHRSSQSIRQELRKRREKHNQYQRYL